jgi:malonyl-CoA O-methyltransferase
MTLRAEYDTWAETYPAVAHNPVMRAEQAVVEPLLRRLSPRHAIDVGSGSGRYLELLTAIGASAIGVDFSFGMLSRGHGTRVCGDARSLPIRSASVDLVNASLMVGDIADLGGWTREMARVLVRGGHLVYSDFHPTWTRFGWQRTFRDADGATHELLFQPHTLNQHRCALADAGFALQFLQEPVLIDEPDRAVRAFRARWGNPAVIVVLHATKR